MNLLRIFKKSENKITRMSFLEDITDDHRVLSKGTVLIPMYCVLALLFSCPQAESCFFLCLDSVKCTAWFLKEKFSGIFFNKSPFVLRDLGSLG